MYMNPTLPGVGGLWPIQAPAHSIAFLSRHIGSGPGVVGLSGMQVQPLVPCRIVRILPSASIATMVAFLLIDCGAALIALLMSSASVGPAFLSLAAFAPDTFASSARTDRENAASANASNDSALRIGGSPNRCCATS